LSGRQSMHYYVLSEGRRGFGADTTLGRPARCVIRDFRLFRAPTGDLFAFEMNRDFRNRVSLTRAERASNHAFPLLSGYVTLLHSTLLILGACPAAMDIEPMMIQCFMSTITPYCFFGVQHGAFQINKQYVARRVAFVQATEYTPKRLGVKKWDHIDPRLRKWLLEDDPQTLYFIVNAPPADIFSIGADVDYKF
jgi:hypothetical protein